MVIMKFIKNLVIIQQTLHRKIKTINLIVQCNKEPIPPLAPISPTTLNDAQSNGDHEVHKESCYYYYMYKNGFNFELLGAFSNEPISPTTLNATLKAIRPINDIIIEFK